MSSEDGGSGNASREIAGYYDRERAASYRKRAATTKAEFRVMSRLLTGMPPGAVILDAPCGNGRLAPFLRSLDPRHLIGVDLSNQMAGQAVDGYDEVVVGDNFALPLTDRSVDLAVSVRLLHHYPDPEDRGAILTELARVARHRALFTFYQSRCLEGLRRGLPWRKRSARCSLPVESVVAEAGQAGLKPLRVRSLLPFVREQTFLLAEIRD